MPGAVSNGNKVSTKFYAEDIVQRAGPPPRTGVVMRCWYDDDVPPPPEEAMDPLLRPLDRGEVGVSFFPQGHREILKEADLDLLDRSFQPGDLCKRSIDDVRSGVVTHVDVKCRLEHAISGENVEGWKTMNEICSTLECELGDYVAYNDWIGQVVELFDEIVVETQNGLVRLPELSSRLSIGDRGNDIIPPPLALPNLFNLFNRLHNTHEDVVVGLKHTVVAISWLAINQSLPSTAAVNAVRPDRFWSGARLSELRLLRSRAEQLARVGDKVLLKSWQNGPLTRHGKPTDPGGDIEVRAYVVKETQTRVTVLWQDGESEVMDAKALIPYLNPDEYDCWPGEHVMWKTEDEKRSAVVLSVDSHERTARVRISDSGETQLASVLELDPHDSPGAQPTSFDGLGVRRGDFVFIHREGDSNGLEPPRVPRIGEVELWVREAPVVHEDGHYAGWREDMYNIGMAIARRREHDDSHEGAIRRVRPGDTTFDWFGEVVKLCLDGSAGIGLPSGATINVPLSRLTRLYDTLEQLEDTLDEGSMLDDEMLMEEIMDEDGNWHTHMAEDEEEGEWEDDEDSMEVEDEWGSDEVVPPTTVELNPSDLTGSSNGGWWGDDQSKDKDAVMAISPEPPASSPEPPSSTAYSPSPEQMKEAAYANGRAGPSQPAAPPSPEDDADSPWKRFDVLSEAPVDHAFYNTAIAQPSRQFLGRLQKEYRALQSSLPDTIVVRAYEDRSDLLRSLIIGPENTPYEDAPFVIDWMLPSDFPQSPPVAHFLSWTNGNGRVNPNLYEEGKVCLSILGTWAGDKSESWSPARSSILQALVSIQGLVLVKEPWFCEPAYDKLRGTEEGTVNSRLYNEKAYVLSRGFVRRALELPLGSLETEINWLYHKQGKLRKVLDDSRALIKKSREEPVDSKTVVSTSDRAVPRLTSGAIITLERTLGKLDALVRASS